MCGTDSANNTETRMRGMLNTLNEIAVAQSCMSRYKEQVLEELKKLGSTALQLAHDRFGEITDDEQHMLITYEQGLKETDGFTNMNPDVVAGMIERYRENNRVPTEPIKLVETLS